MADGKEWKISGLQAYFVKQFSFSPGDTEQLLPSGKHTTLYSRTAWALTYLRQAELVESVGGGANRITSRGVDYLQKCPPIIKPSDLVQFPEFAAFSKGNGAGAKAADKFAIGSNDTNEVLSEKLSPDEAIEASYHTLTATLAQELLEKVKTLPPARFEWLVVQLMLRLGYGGASEGAGQTLGKSGDGGVDGVINQDKLGLEKIYLQAKRYTDKTVGSEEVQAFAGALAGKHASKGVFITTSTFSQNARDYVRYTGNFKISLVDGIDLARLMVEHDLGVSLVQRYDIKKVDSDFFSEE